MTSWPWSLAVQKDLSKDFQAIPQAAFVPCRIAMMYKGVEMV